MSITGNFQRKIWLGRYKYINSPEWSSPWALRTFVDIFMGLNQTRKDKDYGWLAILIALTIVSSPLIIAWQALRFTFWTAISIISLPFTAMLDCCSVDTNNSPADRSQHTESDQVINPTSTTANAQNFMQQQTSQSQFSAPPPSYHLPINRQQQQYNYTQTNSATVPSVDMMTDLGIKSLTAVTVKGNDGSALRAWQSTSDGTFFLVSKEAVPLWEQTLRPNQTMTNS